MTDPSHNPDTGGVGPHRGSPPSTPPRAPRWVKVSAIIVGVLILLVVIAKLTGLGGDHGPGRHTGAGDTPPAGGTAVHALPGGSPVASAPLEGSY